MSRDNLSEEEVVSRLNKQYNYEIGNFAKYYAIHNDGNIDDLMRKVTTFLSKIANQ